MPNQVWTRPRKPSRLARAVCFVVLGFQALVWGAGPVLEARPAAEGLMASAHVEEFGRTGCPPIHSHLTCLICRTLDNGAVTGIAPVFDRPLHEAGTAPCLPDVNAASSGLQLPFGPRAPPHA